MRDNKGLGSILNLNNRLSRTAERSPPAFRPTERELPLNPASAALRAAQTQTKLAPLPTYDHELAVSQAFEELAERSRALQERHGIVDTISRLAQAGPQPHQRQERSVVPWQDQVATARLESNSAERGHCAVNLERPVPERGSLLWQPHRDWAHSELDQESEQLQRGHMGRNQCPAARHHCEARKRPRKWRHHAVFKAILALKAASPREPGRQAGQWLANPVERRHPETGHDDQSAISNSYRNTKRRHDADLDEEQQVAEVKQIEELDALQRLHGSRSARAEAAKLHVHHHGERLNPPQQEVPVWRTRRPDEHAAELGPAQPARALLQREGSGQPELLHAEERARQHEPAAHWHREGSPPARKSQKFAKARRDSRARRRVQSSNAAPNQRRAEQ